MITEYCGSMLLAGSGWVVEGQRELHSLSSSFCGRQEAILACNVKQGPPATTDVNALLYVTVYQPRLQSHLRKQGKENT